MRNVQIKINNARDKSFSLSCAQTTCPCQSSGEQRSKRKLPPRRKLPRDKQRPGTRTPCARKQMEPAEVLRAAANQRRSLASAAIRSRRARERNAAQRATLFAMVCVAATSRVIRTAETMRRFVASRRRRRRARGRGERSGQRHCKVLIPTCALAMLRYSCLAPLILYRKCLGVCIEKRVTELL